MKLPQMLGYTVHVDISIYRIGMKSCFTKLCQKMLKKWHRSSTHRLLERHARNLGLSSGNQSKKNNEHVDTLPSKSSLCSQNLLIEIHILFVAKSLKNLTACLLEIKILFGTA